MTSPGSTVLSRTPLYDLALELNARMTEFSGWEMPVQFSGITREHQAVRTSAGMFDISHMGKFRLVGSTVQEQLQRLVPSDLSRLQPGQAQYTVLLNSQAGIIDDLIFYFEGTDFEATESETTDANRLEPAANQSGGNQRWVVIVNAATTDKDKTWLLQQLDLSQIMFEDCSQTQALLAIQGPQAIAHLQPLVATDLSSLKSFGHLQTTVLGQPAFIARTGYTGEDGVEVMLDPEAARPLWQELLNRGVVPCGLGARDTLRLEAALALYGQDIDDRTTPLEASLGWLVHLDRKGDFIGREILEQQKQQGVARRLVGLQMQGRNIARHGYPVQSGGAVVGEVTSGTMSPTLGQAIALAYVPSELAVVGQCLEVEIRGKCHPAMVVKRPFYRRSA